MNIRWHTYTWVYIYIYIYIYIKLARMLIHTDTNICKVTEFSPLSFWLIIIINQLAKWPITKLLNCWYIGSIAPVILVNVYMLLISVEVMKCMIKLLPLLEWHLTSRAIKQLNEQITTAVLKIGRHCNM